MKTKILILLASTLLFCSCIVKSLNPFYVNKAVSFQETLIGNWEDDDQGSWQIVSVEQAYLEEMKENKPDEQDSKTIEKYGKGYFVMHTRSKKEASFLAMPFTIDGELFMDFIPFNYDTKGTNTLATQHLLKTHSVAKLKIIDDKKVEMIWLDEDRLKQLFEQNKIRIKHERVGLDESLLLTASSEELYQFLKKYNASDIENKWKSDEKFILTASNAKP